MSKKDHSVANYLACRKSFYSFRIFQDWSIEIGLKWLTTPDSVVYKSQILFELSSMGERGEVWLLCFVINLSMLKPNY